MNLKKLITSILLAYIGLMFVFNITPEIQAGIDSANLTGFVLVMATMAGWLLPTGAIIGIFYGIFKLFSGGGKGGA